MWCSLYANDTETNHEHFPSILHWSLVYFQVNISPFPMWSTSQKSADHLVKSCQAQTAYRAFHPSVLTAMVLRQWELFTPEKFQSVPMNLFNDHYINYYLFPLRKLSCSFTLLTASGEERYIQVAWSLLSWYWPLPCPSSGQATRTIARKVWTFCFSQYRMQQQWYWDWAYITLHPVVLETSTWPASSLLG